MKQLLFILTLSAIFSSLAIAQTDKEMQSQIPELKDFHTVIFKLWHEAWPDKNLPLMKDLVAGIDSHLVKIQKVELPGILRDKKGKWDEGVKSLTETAAEFRMAAAASDTQKVLDAAEKVHSGYERLVRTIRPVMKEVDEFHQALYPLYHYYMPKYEKDKIKSSAAELAAKMEPLMKAELPERLKEKYKAFQLSRAQLDKSVKFLQKVANEIDDEKTVVDAVKKMHSDYQSLEKVFD